MKEIKALKKLYILILRGVEVMHNSVSDMSCFIIVAESITFTEAAKKLGVAKSSISYRMAVLEKRLGIKLLERGKKTTLTREGAVYYERAVKVLEEIKS
ncbi:LysR family transcriptional regulator, partial [Pseudomonas aeruginosa]|uniref:LysR family transcriptional regulator n=2 Tax=Pseudomonas TaxID=286 RepID=UPI00131ABEB1